MTRSEILEKAKEIVNGQREQDYGPAERNFGLIGQFWTVYLNHLVTAQDVANMMCLFKIARIRTGRGTEDSYIDAVGYMACGGEIATAANGEKPKDYLKTATDAMKSKYLKFLQDAIEEQTEDKHTPAGINNGPFVPSYPQKAGVKCCCTDKRDVDEDIAKIVAENERKRELLRAIFGPVTVTDEGDVETDNDVKTANIADIVKELREISDYLYRVAADLKEDEDE